MHESSAGWVSPFRFVSFRSGFVTRCGEPGMTAEVRPPADPAGFISVCRNSCLMSGPVLYPRACGHAGVFCGLLLLVSSPLLTAGKKPAVHHLLLWQLLCATDLLGKTTLMVKELESQL